MLLPCRNETATISPAIPVHSSKGNRRAGDCHFWEIKKVPPFTDISPEDGIDKAHISFMGDFLCYFYRFIDCGRSRNS